MRKLLIVPFACAAITAAGMSMELAMAVKYYRAVLIVVTLITMASAFLTMSKFSRGDKLLGSWALLGIAYGISAVRLMAGAWRMIRGGEPLLSPLVDTVLLVGLNVALDTALLIFVLAWRSTGLAAWRGWLVAMGIVIALVVGGLPLVEGFQDRDVDAGLLVSTLGDMVGLAVIVPLAMSAFALRGGLLMHTWLYLAVSELGWLVYDLWEAIPGNVGGWRIDFGVLWMLRVAAVTFAFIATVAQRRALARR